MTDDIVTRLREVERLTRNGEMDRDDIGDIIDWCADEIERLQTQRRATVFENGKNVVFHVSDKYPLGEIRVMQEGLSAAFPNCNVAVMAAEVTR